MEIHEFTCRTGGRIRRKLHPLALVETQATAADRVAQHLGGQQGGSDDEEFVVPVPEREEMAIKQPMKG